MKNNTIKEYIPLQRIENIKNDSKTSEHILNIFKAVLASTPLCGGIASLINDYIPSARLKRLEDFTLNIAEDLNILADKVDEEYLKTEDFIFMFEKCYRGVAENYQQEKLDAFRGILVNSAIQIDIPEKEYFLNIVNNLSAVHIKLLKSIYRKDRNSVNQKEQYENYVDFLSSISPNTPREIISPLLEDLIRYLLIKKTYLNTEIFPRKKKEEYFEYLDQMRSSMGEKFINFCISPCLKQKS